MASVAPNRSRASSSDRDTDVGKSGSLTDLVEKCPVCLTKMEPWQEGMFDDRFGMPGLYDLVLCSTCGLVRTWPSLNDRDLSRIYGAYYPRANIDLSALPLQAHKPSTRIGRIRIWLCGVGNQGHYATRPGMKVLDYGCGMGTSLFEVQALGADAYGVEADPTVKRVADYWGLKIHIGGLEENPFPNTKFDLISLNQVIEHIPEPRRLLQLLRVRLEDEGIVVLSFPNLDSIYRRLFGRRWINWHVPYHIFHFNLKAFGLLCEHNGWKIARWKTVTPNVWTMLQLKSLAASSTMGVANPLWSSIRMETGRGGAERTKFWFLNGLRRSARRAVRTVGIFLLYGVITVFNRVIDAAGYGDSLVVFIKPAR